MNPPRVPWSIVVMLCATATASYICRVNVSTAGALLMDEFSLTQVEMGRIFSAFLLGYAFFQIPAGMLADRFGARRLLTWAAWLWVIMTAAQAAVGRGPFQMDAATSVLAVFLICRFLLGITEAPTYPGSAEGVSRWILPAYQGRANGIVVASVGLGSAIAPVLVSNVMVHWGWRTAILTSALPALIIAVLWLTISEPPAAATVMPNERVDGMATGVSNLRSSPKESGVLRTSFILLTISYTLRVTSAIFLCPGFTFTWSRSDTLVYWKEPG